MAPVLVASFIACIIAVTGGAPTFDKGFESVLAEDTYFEVLCLASGVRPMYYKWYDMYEQGISSTPNKDIYSYTTYNGSWLIIPKPSINHQGIYTCTANNAEGLSSKLFNITVALNMRNETDNVSAAIISSRAVRVTNSSVLFDIKTVGSGEMIEVLYVDDLTDQEFRNSWRFGQPYEVRNLNASASYTFKFKLPEDYTWFNCCKVVLLPAAPEIIFRGLQDRTVQVEWSVSYDSIRRGTIDKHVISYYMVQQMNGNNWKPRDCATHIEVPSCNSPRYTITDLSKGFYHEISVRAHTKSGFGSASYNKVYIP